jgi:ABC-type branched-subunit amino acid transport system permease subunit
MTATQRISVQIGVGLLAWGYVTVIMGADSGLWVTLLLLIGIAGVVGLRRHEGLARIGQRAFRNGSRPAVAVGMAGFLLLPVIFSHSAYLIHIGVMAMLYCIMALGLNITLGCANLTHFATSAFFGVGAYTAALLSIHYQTGFVFNLVLGSLVASLAGVLLAMPVLRAKTYYLALVTMAYGLVLFQFVNTVKFTGGPAGLVLTSTPTIFGYDLGGPLAIGGLKLPFQANFFYLIFLGVVLAAGFCRLLHDSWAGMTFNYIREDEIATRAQGIDVNSNKLLAFAVDGAFSGFAGAFYVNYISYVGPPDINIMVSVVVVTMVILGGMGNVRGVILGAVIMIVIPEKFRAFQDFRLMIYGIVILAVLMYRPTGLLPQRIRRYGSAAGIDPENANPNED